MSDSKLFRPSTFAVEADGSKAATTAWQHCIATFSNFYDTLTEEQRKKPEPFKYNLLVNHIAPNVFEHVSIKETYDDAVTAVNALYIQPTNEIAARNELQTRPQQSEETLNQYLQALKLLSKPCNLKAVTATVNRDDNMRDSFIQGLISNDIRCRLLENSTLTLAWAY